MKGYKSENIRNVALVGHGGCGKTTFLEAALLETGVISRLGKVEDGNTVSDYDKMEIEKGYSISTSIVPVEFNKVKLNFVDTPGFFDFVGEVNSALRAVEAAVIVVDASSGVQVGTEKAWDSCNQFGVPRFFLVNKTDKENVDVDSVVAQLKDKFGSSVVTLDDREAMEEEIAGTDEELMEAYFENMCLTDEQFAKGLSKGIGSGDIAPVFMCSAVTGEGIKEALQSFIDFVPKAKDHAPYPAKNGSDEDIEVAVDEAGKPAALIFKTISDSFLGKISLAKIISGTLKSGQSLYNAQAEKEEKLGSFFFLRGNQKEDAAEAVAGDIVAIGKLQYTKTGDTLCEKANIIKFPEIEFPSPTLYQAVVPVKQGDDEKMGSSYKKLMEEDPSFVLENNVETHQTLIGGQGDIQLNIINAKLKDKFGVEVATVPQKIAYRETIKGTSDVQGKHKKQSGGAGQYGDVWIKFSPSQEEFEFGEEIFGGSVPKNYWPAVEKGLRECMEKGPLAGCKVVNVKAILYDGSYHDVDSNETAFKIAASLAFKKGIVEANPCLLEPVMKLEVTVPDDYVGAVMGDLPNRRGAVMGMDPQVGGGQILHAEAPQAELFDYAIALRSMTQARGSFTMEFARYAEVPGQIAQKIIADYKAEQEANAK
ncbi:MAG: elongation factor G [Clostridiales bacterium]|nr:elongation factor G [Clostridiales bacterium]MDD7036208.1 elongation factor G [Bacillota bacterium]MDY2920981.1 elongation factor G [Lentihominibacter sp.]